MAGNLREVRKSRLDVHATGERNQRDNTGIEVVADDGRVLYVDRMLCRMLGYRSKELVNKHFGNIIDPSDRKEKIAELTGPPGTKTDREVEVRFLNGKGISVPLEVISLPFDAAEHIAGTRLLVVREKLPGTAETEMQGLIDCLPNAVTVVDHDARVIAANRAVEKLLGYSRGELLDRHIDVLLPNFARHTGFFGQGPQLASGRALAHSGQRKDGTSFSVELNVQRFVFGNRPAAVISLSVSDSSPKRLEPADIETDQRFRTIADAAPVMIWVADAERSLRYANEAWIAFTGEAPDKTLGDGWLSRVHSDDQARLAQELSAAFESQEAFRIVGRFLRHDGQYRWLVVSGVPRSTPEGEFLGFVGIWVDETDQRAANEALRTVGGRLLEAQEEERKHIARELHDDISQQLAMLSVEIEELRQQKLSGEALDDRLTVIGRHVETAAQDVQAISHRLHAARLEYLGMIPAMRGFCSELAARHHVNVHFSYQAFPESISNDVSLALFRVLQEALHNALKYSGVTDFDVQVTADADHVQLDVSDSGRGFIPEDALEGGGIGLISMQERMKLVNGTLDIISGVQQGTHITARAPLG